MTEEFRSFLVSIGLQPGVVSPDDRWRRCPTDSHPHKKNGAYKLTVDGRIGWGQDHAVHERPVAWRPERTDEKPLPFDPEKLRRAHEEARRQRDRAISEARDFYQKCAPLCGGHPYLDSHGLGMNGCLGLKVDPKGWLVVPAFKGRDLMTVQRISPDGEKLFWRHAPVKGASYTVERKSASITVLCEGLATGLAIYAAAPMTRVVIAFNSGNLKEASIRHAGMLAIAADNDWRTAERLGSNPGIEAAQRAADAFGCGVAIPEGIQGSDWCDFRIEEFERRMNRIPRPREADVRRAVDAEIASSIMRAARLRVVS